MYHARQRPVPIIAVVTYLHSEALELKTGAVVRRITGTYVKLRVIPQATPEPTMERSVQDHETNMFYARLPAHYCRRIWILERSHSEMTEVAEMTEMAESGAVAETDTRRCSGLASDSTKWCRGQSRGVSRSSGPPLPSVSH